MLRCQLGDRDAFTRLFARFGDRSRRYLEGILGYPEAEDAQQEVWITVYRRISSLANPAGFRTWLFQITRNRAVDHLRRSRRMRELQVPHDVVEAGSAGVSEEEPLELSGERVAAALGALSPHHREVLVLRFWEDLTYPEIALVVGAPVGTIRSRLHHAKRLLRDELERGYKEHTGTN
ncbi:MAG: RNA polymerase sigma factor [Longimicrobiales bacterium]